MLKLKPILTTILLSMMPALMMGCGEKSKGGSGEILPPTVANEKDIRWLKLEDPNCNGSEASVKNLATATIYEWDGAKIAAKQVAFQGASSGDGAFKTLNTDMIVLGFEQLQTCRRSSSSEVKCESQEIDTKKLSALHICRSNGTYSRDSLEAMTLTTAHLTEKAFAFYNSISGSLSGLESLSLLIQPKIVRSVTDEDGQTKAAVLANNAGFSIVKGTDKKRRPFFVIFPTSMRSFAESPVNLWEVPFVMSHEFAHYIFYRHVGETARASGLSISQGHGLSFINKMPWSKQPGGLNLAAGSNVAQLALDGINETFADLFAYFSGNSAKEQLAGVSCLDVSRDPSSPVTKGNSSKGLSTWQMDIYEGRAEAPEVSDCYEPTYDGEHDIATALGYPLARFIEQSTPNASAHERAKLLLDWAKRMQELAAYGAGGLTVDTLVQQLILTAKSTLDISTACGELKPLITGLSRSTRECGGL